MMIFFALSSILVSWANDSVGIVALEMMINSVLILSVLLFGLKKYIRFWLLLLVPVIIIQIYVLYLSPPTTSLNAILVFVLVVPAAVMGFYVGLNGIKYLTSDYGN